MEIKHLKRFFFCLYLYFNPVLSRNSFTTSVLQMYIGGNLVQRNSTCILYFGDVTFWLCQTSDNSKYFLHSLDFEITRLTCILISFWIFDYCFDYHCAIFYSLNAGFFNTIRVSNSLDPDQA